MLLVRMHSKVRRDLARFAPRLIAGPARARFDAPMPKDPYIREKFTRESSTARRAVREYFKRYPKEQFQTELESWRYLPSQTIEFIMKRLREPVEAGG